LATSQVIPGCLPARDHRLQKQLLLIFYIILDTGGYNARVEREIVIAGGGLSGLATAVLLARRGARVRVYDRRRGGGGRFAGGWQVLENGSTRQDALAELAELGFEQPPPVIPMYSALFLDPFGGRHQVRSREPYTYFIRRGPEASLDSWLREQALAAGVELVEGGSAPAGADVAATGPRVADGVARELIFASDLPDTIAVLFDPAVAPTGYAYLFCLAGHATFGVAQVRKLASLPAAEERAWAVFRREFGEFAVENRRRRGQFMNFFVPRSLLDGQGRHYVGEAAGVQDFLYGLGNRLALRTAALAADSLLGEWDEGRFRRTVLRPMAATVALRALYEATPRCGWRTFCKVASRRDFRDFLIRLQRPRPAVRALSALVRVMWRERRGCRHGPLCTWCRRAVR